MNEYLDPLPSELATLTAKSRHASQHGLDTVDTIIARLEAAKAQLAAPGTTTGTLQLAPLALHVKTANAIAAAAHKEWGTAVTRFAKSVDKKFPGPPLPLFPGSSNSTPLEDPALVSSLELHQIGWDNQGKLKFESNPPKLDTVASSSTFTSAAAIEALNETIALHLARLGAFNSLDTFLSESPTTSAPSPDVRAALENLHAVLRQLKEGVCTTALEWVYAHPDADPAQDLEFELRKEEYIRLLLGGQPDLGLSNTGDDLSMSIEQEPSEREPLLSSTNTLSAREGQVKLSGPTRQPPTHVTNALQYGGQHFRRLLTPARTDSITALLTAPVYMPFSRLIKSPYGAIFAPYAPAATSAANSFDSPDLAADHNAKLVASFSAAYLRSIGLPKDSPLTVVTDIGSGGAMAKIQKVRAVMKEKKTEWSAVGELPVEIPLPTTRRYHSIFACPVSKEQSTATNPPMLLPCGHVIARESLARLARGTPTLKCPYCPVVSHVSAAVKVHF